MQLLRRLVNCSALSSQPCGLQVIDAEMGRRQVLEENPVASTREGAVVFDTSEVPWWAWVRRFHLPEVQLQAKLMREYYACRVQLST